MSKIKNLRIRISSFILANALLLTADGLMMLGIHKKLEMATNKRTLVESAIINQEKYESEYLLYDEYINLIKDEIIATGMHKSALDVFQAYQYIQDNGLMSYGNNFRFVEAEYDIIGNLGMSVLSGKGVCRNQAANLCNLLVALGYDATVSHGELYNTTFISGTNNHALTCVREDNKYYLFDPANRTIYLCTALGQFKSIDSEDSKFYPSVYADEIYGCLKDNASLHVYLVNDYKDRDEIIALRDESYAKAKSYHDYYTEYEREKLEDLEEKIYSGVAEILQNDKVKEEEKSKTLK